MRKEKTLFILGIWVAILPYLGFRESWRRILFILTGFVLMYLAYLFYLEVKARLAKNENTTKTFVDNIESSATTNSNVEETEEHVS